ncbi:MAG: class I SAM-dependent methyltransferase [Chloroflexi bacterium]|nr:class I SAM-dependent methyltransferase [Chloroflexota bacterium]MCH8348949.1 class I SAM-dependent methyltransferase [Chloroflexota bacterium]MCI0780128.1 class I SAM-dependent methyltransferase [Chloroflexota bacterium]MCI0785492.1 class I SAM-dependent methyltransferase [Chloroflexota bacterium]MCI0792772.1 class I SAM-dependent methyltransferase [Chloroflexota bacterium]
MVSFRPWDKSWVDDRGWISACIEGSSVTDPDYSADFYRKYAREYAHVSAEFIQSVYIKSSHPGLKHDWDLWERLKQLVGEARRGLDAGCGAGARDVYNAWTQGYDITGVDSIEENIQAAWDLHPDIADRVFVADLQQPLPFDDQSFDFVLCNAVIQHIEARLVREMVLPQLIRVLRPGGVLQLMFKNGQGVATVFDKDYGIDRSFQLFDEHEILGILQELGMALVEAESPDELGGFLYFTDPKPIDYCVFFARKDGA